MENIFHSVRLDDEKCRGCTNCIKRCPTQAIRVRNKKAYIISDRCIDCGECIRVCPHHAKYAVSEHFNELVKYKYRIALPAPSLYGQFNNLDNVDYVLTGLKRMGFDEVFEVSKAAELVSDASRRMLENGELQRPVISSACPAVLRLIRTRFPNLIKNILPLFTPVDLAARLARKAAKKKNGLENKDIGVFFISPCPAKRTAITNPLCYDGGIINGAFAIKDIYPVLVQTMDKLSPDEVEPLGDSGIIGVGWASSGGEAAGLLKERYLAADGIENVINVLEELEDEKLNDLDFIELNCCTGGCVGGVLTVENPYVAKARIQRLRKFMPVSCNRLPHDFHIDLMGWTHELTPSPAMKLADNVIKAMRMMSELKRIEDELPGLDCGICGAPSCRALADDIVRGYAEENDCIFWAARGSSEESLPAPFRKKEVVSEKAETTSNDFEENFLKDE
ncbi:MAG: [Fe-Fe] hydrogenase large subunit C-terminal domain-containing protein [Clostridia bacterium]|nr:[Fe-Fe] hydrogenase large subunit C-terminal domain-containing protein [Clostridia bacterium]